MDIPSIKIIESKKSVCSRILTPKQVGPICWFMAAFVAMFYSQRSRKILLDESINWDTSNELYSLLKHVLDDKYLKVEDKESEDYMKFSDDTFKSILTLLHKINNKDFPYNPDTILGGFSSEYYIGKLYELLNIRYKMFDYFVKDNTLVYSYLNSEYNIQKYNVEDDRLHLNFDYDELIKMKKFKYKYEQEEDTHTPPILIIRLQDKEAYRMYTFFLKNNIISEGIKKLFLKSMNKKIIYNGVEYNLDSVILANWNINKDNGHAIAGITCKKKKYIYNGWTRTSMDPVMGTEITRNIPCELMRYNWNIKKHGDFCLDTKKCIPAALKRKLEYYDSCFNFSKGTRILIYVRKDVNHDTSSESKSKSRSTDLSSLYPHQIPPPPMQPPQLLPPGWEKVRTDDGEVYYINHNDKTSHWELPKYITDMMIYENSMTVKAGKGISKAKPRKKCPKGTVVNPKKVRYIDKKKI